MKYLVDDVTMRAIADAIREKTGRTDEISVADMADVIGAIQHYDGGKLAQVMSAINSGMIRLSITADDLRGADKIRDYAFYYDHYLVGLEIPKTVLRIGPQSIWQCVNLSSLLVEEGNPVYHSTDNCIIETNSRKLIVGCGSSTIPADGSVTILGEYCFSSLFYNKAVETFVVPDAVVAIEKKAFEYAGFAHFDFGGVKTIGEQAFEYARSLVSANFICVETIGRWAFEGCQKLTSVVLPSSVLEIGAGAFKDCEGLIKADLSATAILKTDGTFSECSALREVVLPTCLEQIGYGTFKGCSALENINIPNNVIYVGIAAFDGCTNLPKQGDFFFVDGWILGCDGKKTVLELPDGAKGIASEALKNAGRWATSIVIPPSLQIACYNAYVGCGHLESVHISDLSAWVRLSPDGHIGATPFYHSPSAVLYLNGEPVVDVVVPEGITECGVFRGYKALKSIVLPSSTTKIGYGNFQSCSSLEKVVVLAETPPELSSGAFLNCDNLSKIAVKPGFLEVYKSETNWSNYADIMVEESWNGA